MTLACPTLDRRRLLLLALAFGGCAGAGVARAFPSVSSLPPLRTAPFPVGVAAMSEGFGDPDWSGLVTAQFDRITPEWEMKMEVILKPDGAFDWSRPDRLVGAARSRGLKVFAHNMVWFQYKPQPFLQRAGDRRRFEAFYRRYILAVGRRYQGRVIGWDVVNEPVGDDGTYRDCLWTQNLGLDYVRLAFEHAREADPDAVLFMNDYNLESLPEKRRAFLKLAEDLLKAGAPLGGLGTQTHLVADLPPGSIRTAMADLGSLGLPVHVSEFDISLNRAKAGIPRETLIAAEPALVGETVEAFMALPETQRWAFTAWGARDRDSWLRRPPEDRGPEPDQPLLFDDAGRPKPAAVAFVEAMQGRMT